MTDDTTPDFIKLGKKELADLDHRIDALDAFLAAKSGHLDRRIEEALQSQLVHMKNYAMTLAERLRLIDGGKH